MVHRFLVKLFLLTLLLWVAFGQLQTAKASLLPPVNDWTDSLEVRIADSTVVMHGGDYYLEFKVVVERKNLTWNNNDTILGDCDIYFFLNRSAFSADPPELVWVNNQLYPGSAASPSVGGDPNAKLQIAVREWGWQELQIALVKRDGEDKTNDDFSYCPTCNVLFPLKLNVVDTLCKLRWKLKSPMAAVLGVMWDPASVGLQTLGGNPIIETLKGNIYKNPDPVIELEELPKPLWVCEGDGIEIPVKAASSGDQVKLAWFDSIAGGSWHPIDSGQTLHSFTEGGAQYEYTYELTPKGDTFRIVNVPGNIDSIYFVCMAWDPSLPLAAAKYTNTQLFVRDSIWGFITPETDQIVMNRIDTVTKCEEGEVTLRFNIFGPSMSEVTMPGDEYDTLYVAYRQETNNIVQDTLIFPMADLRKNNVEQVGGKDVFYWNFSVPDTGKYYIYNSWTKYCSNAAPASAYDSVYVKLGDSQVLERLSMLKGEILITDSTNSPYFQNPNFPDTIRNMNASLGHLVRWRFLPITYQADSVGMDTIIYKYKDSKGKCTLYREIEITDYKYLSLKVFLEGAYLNSTSMKGYQDYYSAQFPHNIFPTDIPNRNYISPYDSSVLVAKSRFNTVIADAAARGENFVDWVYIRLLKVLNSTDPSSPNGHCVDSVTALLRTDGVVCDTTGEPYVKFKNLPDPSYYVAVEHKSHLGVMSANPVTLKTNPTGVGDIASLGTDFTQIPNVFKNATLAGTPLTNSLLSGLAPIYMLRGGLVTPNYLISVRDATTITNKRNSSGYMREDVNLNFKVDNTDYSMSKKNKGSFRHFKY